MQAMTECSPAFVKGGKISLNEILLEMENITKKFPGVKALDRVNLQVEKGEIHALVGEARYM